MNNQNQAQIWDFYKPRHTHTWNMLVLSWRALNENPELGFECEYHWENFIIRLWLYRATIKTLTKLDAICNDANSALQSFDNTFDNRGKNSLKAIRDMIEHFDDYAAGVGRGPANRESDLDPWRTVTRERYERGNWSLDRKTTYEAAISLRTDAKTVSDQFIAWYKAEES